MRKKILIAFLCLIFMFGTILFWYYDTKKIQKISTDIINYDAQTSYSNMDEFYNAIQEIQFSYYMRGNRLQYNSAKRVTTQSISPEQATRQNRGYIVCSGFTHNVYDELLGICIPTGADGLNNYAKNNIGRTEVMAYGAKDSNNNVKMTFYNNGASIFETNEPTINNVIPRLHIRRYTYILRSYNYGI